MATGNLYGLDPAEQQGFDSQRSKINLDFGHANAMNAFQRGNVLANRASDFGNLKRQFFNMRNSLPGQYVGRGLMNSGIYKQGLQDFNQNRVQQFGDLARKYQQMVGQLDLQRQQGLESQYAGLADINAQEAARRAQLASQIRGVY